MGRIYSASIGEVRNVCRIWVRKLRERGPLGGVGVYGRIILNWILEK
jgi:hypothetical protein